MRGAMYLVTALVILVIISVMTSPLQHIPANPSMGESR